MRPKRTNNKYWTGTRKFNHIQYESDVIKLNIIASDIELCDESENEFNERILNFI